MKLAIVGALALLALVVLLSGYTLLNPQKQYVCSDGTTVSDPEQCITDCGVVEDSKGDLPGISTSPKGMCFNLGFANCQKTKLGWHFESPDKQNDVLLNFEIKDLNETAKECNVYMEVAKLKTTTATLGLEEGLNAICPASDLNSFLNKLTNEMTGLKQGICWGTYIEKIRGQMPAPPQSISRAEALAEIDLKSFKWTSLTTEGWAEGVVPAYYATGQVAFTVKSERVRSITLYRIKPQNLDAARDMNWLGFISCESVGECIGETQPLNIYDIFVGDSETIYYCWDEYIDGSTDIVCKSLALAKPKVLVSTEPKSVELNVSRSDYTADSKNIVITNNSEFAIQLRVSDYPEYTFESGVRETIPYLSVAPGFADIQPNQTAVLEISANTVGDRTLLGVHSEKIALVIGNPELGPYDYSHYFKLDIPLEINVSQ